MTRQQIKSLFLYHGYNCTLEPDWKRGYQEVLSSGAEDRTVKTRVKGPKLLPYVMTFTPWNWLWLKWIMAVANSTDGATKTHTFTMRDAVASYKLEWARRHTTDHVFTIIGNAVKSATLSWTKATGEGAEGFLKVALTCVGQDETEGSSACAMSNLTKVPFQYRMCKFTIDDTEYKEVNNGEMTIDNGIDENDSRYCNSTYGELLGEVIPKTFRVTGRVNVNIKDSTDYDHWNAGTDIGTSITTGTATAGASTTLTDSGSGWTIDAYAGKNVEITAGTGKGQVRYIVSNTADTLTIAPAWTTNPSTDSVFKIVKVNTLLFDRDGTGNDQILFTFYDFYYIGAIPPTNLEGVTSVDLVWAARGFSRIVSRDDISQY